MSLISFKSKIIFLTQSESVVRDVNMSEVEISTTKLVHKKCRLLNHIFNSSIRTFPVIICYRKLEFGGGGIDQLYTKCNCINRLLCIIFQSGNQH